MYLENVRNNVFIRSVQELPEFLFKKWFLLYIQSLILKRVNWELKHALNIVSLIFTAKMLPAVILKERQNDLFMMNVIASVSCWKSWKKLKNSTANTEMSTRWKEADQQLEKLDLERKKRNSKEYNRILVTMPSFDWKQSLLD